MSGVTRPQLVIEGVVALAPVGATAALAAAIAAVAAAAAAAAMSSGVLARPTRRLATR